VRLFRLALFSLLGCSLLGCAGGMPLLHPARTLPLGDVRASGGFSGTVAVGGLADALHNAQNDAAQNPNAPGNPGSDPTYTRGALVAASIGPGLAPLIAARVGVGAQAEGGIAYTGRGARIDMRRSFDLSPSWALSIGAGGSAAFYGHQDGSPLPDVDLGHLHGWGADVPVLVGYESPGGLYMLWVGARAGGEHVDISALSTEPNGMTLGGQPITLSATRFWGGGLVGLAAGFRHVHVAMELDVSYATISGDFNQAHADVSGVSIVPATAVWWQF
jgi:hypothetical protein